MTFWFHDLLGYEFEVSHETGTYTGWYRRINGRLADGRWREYHPDGRRRFGRAAGRPR